MCTGIEIISAIGAISSAASSFGLIGGNKGGAPQVVSTPVEDTEIKASQDAAAKKLAQRRAARANSLLSAAGAAGDPTDPLTTAAGAYGKTALGA